MAKRGLWLGLLISLLVAVGAYWIWFFRWDIYTWGDWGYYFPQNAREFIAFPQIWSPAHLGGIDIGLSLYPMAQLLPGVLSRYVEPYVALHLIYLLPNVLLCAIGGFLLSRYIYKSNLAGVVASLVYSFNTYFLIIRGGHLPLMNAFALAPFALLAFLHGLKTSKTYFFLLAGFLSSLAAAYEVRGALIIFGLLALLLLFYLPRLSWKTRLAAISTFIVAGLLNIYWVMGLFFTGGDASDLVVFGRQLYGQGYAHIVRSAVLQLHQWSPNGLIGPGIQPTPAYLWLIPLVAFASLYYWRKNRVVVCFGVVALLGIFFSKMLGQPFPHVYEWMYKNIPGFSIFREPSKFFFLIAIGYSVLLAGAVERVWLHRQDLLRWRIIRVLFVSLICGLFLMNTRGIITGSLGELLKPRQIPSDYVLANGFFETDPASFRVAYYPVQSRWNLATANRGGVGGLSLAESDWASINNYDITGLKFTYFDQMTNIFTYSFANKLFDMSTIKYVVIPTQDIANNDDMFAIYGSREKYIDLISKLKFLKEVEIGTDELLVFENAEVRPRIYLTERVDSIHDAMLSAQPVSFQRLSSSMYGIQMATSAGSVVNFADRYHSGWKLSPDPVTWVNVILGKQRFVSDEKHIRNDAGLNSFVLSSDDLQSSQNFTLYFTPQAYLEFGGRISLISLFVVAGYLLIILIRSRRND